ncbi:unnamed protein product [Pararhodospirillum photometricum DSM 122]|uniref:Uncharacterized protein n=1 Tax=Pararhodospirillum photometricum DSM 122 TaxID=1150469 RepID=H6SKA6_PARPM|nr:unnamed protein product [Pararhodospirillum photometricum DSM 122]
MHYIRNTVFFFDCYFGKLPWVILPCFIYICISFGVRLRPTV